LFIVADYHSVSIWFGKRKLLLFNSVIFSDRIKYINTLFQQMLTMNLADLQTADPVVAQTIKDETSRQNTCLELIPSENFVSRSVLEAMGSTLTNKYAEGYPGKRYYGGNHVIDQVETLAIDRCKELFGCEHVNVQPNSGSPANMAVYFAMCEVGDKILGMNLSHGGHLTHGHPINFSGKLYDFSAYGVDKETHLIDMDEVRKIAEKEKPKILLSGASAYPREIDFKEFAEIAKDVGAISMADIAHVAGLIAAGVHISPFPETDIVTTTTHKTLRGPRSAVIMSKEEFGKAIDKAVFPGLQGGPHEHTIAAKAVAFKEAMTPEFKDYSKQIIKNARVLAEEMMNYGYRLISGGTDNHLLLMDVTPQGLTGSIAETALDESGITLNKNMIPFDERSPFNPSGIRFGTPAITTRGMKESEMKLVAELMHRVLQKPEDETIKQKVKAEIVELCKLFPLYPER